MEDPKFKGTDLVPVYEEQEPLPPPKLLYYKSRNDGTEYNEDGSERVAIPEPVEVKAPEPTPEPSSKFVPFEPDPEPAPEPEPDTLAADEKAADEYGKAQTRRKK